MNLFSFFFPCKKPSSTGGMHVTWKTNEESYSLKKFIYRWFDSEVGTMLLGERMGALIKCQWQYICHQEIKFVDLFSSASLPVFFFLLFAAAVVDRDFWVRSVLRESVLFNMDEHSPSILCRPWCLQAAKR